MKRKEKKDVRGRRRSFPSSSSLLYSAQLSPSSFNLFISPSGLTLPLDISLPSNAFFLSCQSFLFFSGHLSPPYFTPLDPTRDGLASVKEVGRRGTKKVKPRAGG